MSKKNNKTRRKKYVEIVKQLQKDNEEEIKRRKEMKLAKISANKLVNEIEDFGLDDEKSDDDKMEVEKKESKHHKKKGFRLKHGRYS